jgi:hypothetical protein
MFAITLAETPAAIEGDGIVFRKQPIGGGMSVSFVDLPKGADLRPALAGLPEDLCQCPHWGYVISGRVRMHTREGFDDYGAEQAFYWAPGHAPEALENVRYVDFSPTDELDHVIEHVTSGHG